MALAMPNQYTGGTVPGDTEIITTPTSGNWLIVYLSWTTISSTIGTTGIVGDWSRNMWTLLYSSTQQASKKHPTSVLYTQVWACPNVQHPGWPNLGVYGASLPTTSADATSLRMSVFEISGMANGFVAVDAVVTNTASAATSLSVTLPAPSGGADCLMLTAVSTTSGAAITNTGTGWTAVTTQTAAGPNLTAGGGWKESTAGQTNSWTSGSATNWVGVGVSVRVTGTGPTQVNPNWPVLDFQLGLGYTLSTPTAAVTWTSVPNRLTSFDHERGIQFELGTVQSSPTDFVLRNDDGALSPRTAGAGTATGNGTSTTFVCSNADAATTTVGDYFRLTTSAGVLKEFTVFQVTGISVGVTSTVTFAKANGAGGGALASTATGDKYFGCPIDIYVPYRVVATWQGKQYPVTTGWIERWPQVWNDAHWGDSSAIGIDPMATLTAQDYSPLAGLILTHKPHSYWPLGDAGGTTDAQNVSGVGTALLSQVQSSGGSGAAGQASFGQSTQNLDTGFGGTLLNLGSNLGDPGSGWAVAGLTAAEFTSHGFALVGNDTTFPSIANGVTIVGVAFDNITDADLSIGAPTAPTVVVLSNTVGAGFHGRVIKYSINNNNASPILYPWVTVWDKTTGTSTINKPNTGAQWAYDFNLWALTFNQTSWAVYAQGAPSGTGTANLVTNFDRIDIGGEADSIANGLSFNCLHSHIAIIPRVLTASEISELHNMVTRGYLFSASATDQTIARKLNTVGWKGARILNWTTTDVGADVAASTIAEKVTSIADDNADRMFTDAAGQLQFRARSRAVNQTVAAVIGDRPDLGEIPYVGDSGNLQIDYDPTYIYNDVSVVNDGAVTVYDRGGTTVVSTRSQPSIDRYGLRTLGKTVSFTDNTQTADVANYYLAQYAFPRMRVSTVLIDAATNTSAFSFVLSVEVGDLVTFNRRPIGAPQISIPCVVLDIKHSVAADTWETTLTLGPAPV